MFDFCIGEEKRSVQKKGKAGPSGEEETGLRTTEERDGVKS